MSGASFRLTGLLESGELADLFRATSAERGEVVVKLFHERTSDAHYARALVRNSSALNTRSLQGVVHWVDVGFVQRRLAAVREHVEGPLLGEALVKLHSRELIAPAPLALMIVLELLETMQRVHDAGLVHGALTPGNVLLSKSSGAPAIFDFGALHALMAVPQLKKTFVGRGRSAYRAPEVTHGDAPDALSDVYSLGAMAYELLTLHEPRIAEGAVSTRREGLAPPSRLDRRLNARIDPILLRALDPQPYRRFKTCGDFAGALRNYLTTSGSLPSPADLKALVDELVGLSSRTLGTVPFSDFFALEGIDGIELPEVQDGLPTLDNPRPSFSGGAVGEEDLQLKDTIESPPAFAEFKPSVRPVRGPPPESEGTDPGGAGPLEEGWEAPPSTGPVAQTRKRAMTTGLEPTMIRQPRHPRVKLVEDFQSARPDMTPELPPSSPQPPPAKAPAKPRAPVPPASRPAALPERLLTPENVVPVGARIGKGTLSNSPRLSTGERHIEEVESRQKKMRRVALLVGLGGVTAFVAAVLWMREPTSNAPVAAPLEPDAVAEVRDADAPVGTGRGEVQEPSADPKLRALSSTIAKFERANAKSEDEGLGGELDRPPPTARAAFVSIQTNVPARVFVDGNRVATRTPLERYPVWPGDRTIEIEEPRSGERRVLRVSLRKGKAQMINEVFAAPTP